MSGQEVAEWLRCMIDLRERCAAAAQAEVRRSIAMHSSYEPLIGAAVRRVPVGGPKQPRGQTDNGTTGVLFSARHYVPSADGLDRVLSDPQSVQFTTQGDSLMIYLPPPAACVLYIDLPARQVIEYLQKLRC